MAGSKPAEEEELLGLLAQIIDEKPKAKRSVVKKVVTKKVAVENIPLSKAKAYPFVKKNQLDVTLTSILNLAKGEDILEDDKTTLVKDVKGSFIFLKDVAKNASEFAPNQHKKVLLNKDETYRLIASVSPQSSLGIIPSTVKYVHRYKNRVRLMMEFPPGINLVWWGNYERDPNCKQYLLAQPYRFVVVDFVPQGNEMWHLYGARMFNSPEAFYSWDQPLYHINLPNSNCTSYGGNGMGWMCFYHRSENLVTLSDMANLAWQRCGGGEAYNNGNMPGTQGSDFYFKMKMPDYFCKPLTWEKKSETDGYMWTLDPDIMVPVLTKDLDRQEAHQAGAPHLTVGQAFFSPSRMYYSDNTSHDFHASMFLDANSDAHSAKNVLQPIQAARDAFNLFS